MRAVGRSVVSNFASYSGAQIHSHGRHTFQAVAVLIVICKHTSFCRLGGLLNYCGCYFLSAFGNRPRVVFCF